MGTWKALNYPPNACCGQIYGFRLVQIPFTRTDRQIAILLFASGLAFYLRMIAPDMLPGDAGELQFAAWRWGLAHPTGYPLYLLLGGLWQRLLALLGVNPAAALNAFSALTAAIALGFFFLLLRGWLTGPVVVGRAVALWAAVTLAVNPTFWSQALIAEVYALHALFLILILLLAQRLAAKPWGNHAAGPVSGALLSPGAAAPLFLLLGLSLTHHAMTVLLVPGLLLYLFVVDPRWWRSPALWLTMALATLLPLLLYLYVPLRSGPMASPWYHQTWGEGVLSLYDNSWSGFWDFLSGRSISVGFKPLGGAVGGAAQALLLWRLHFNWPIVLLMLLGVTSLFLARRWDVVALTIPYVILQQVFNLFYDIGDILVYYVPLYVCATLWAGFGAQRLAVELHRLTGRKLTAEPAETAQQSVPDDVTASAEDASDSLDPNGGDRLLTLAAVFILLLFVFPLRTIATYAPRLDQSGSGAAREGWEPILAANPPEGALMVSNDRNEIVPLFYLQAVEGRALGLTGIFPGFRPMLALPISVSC